MVLAMAAIWALARPEAIRAALLLLVVLSVAPITGRLALARGDWFHPYAFPLGGDLAEPIQRVRSRAHRGGV